jgi:hypothetical protein
MFAAICPPCHEPRDTNDGIQRASLQDLPAAGAAL